jgi:hypothetical protein
MDKDLASAILLERCQCYNKSLESVKKTLAKTDVDPREHLWALRIVKALGEVFLSQRFMDKAMECYQILLTSPEPDPEDLGGTVEECPEPELVLSPFADLGPNSVTVSTSVNPDVMEILQSLQRAEGNEGKEISDLVREGIYQLFLKYSGDKDVREIIFDKIRNVVGR